MSINYTNRKGQIYTLYVGQTKTGKPRYYLGRVGLPQGEPAREIPAGFTISESINAVVSLVKDRPQLIQPEELASVEAELKRHPEAGRYRISVKQKVIEIYERVGADLETLYRDLKMPLPLDPTQLKSRQEATAQYMPVLGFTLVDPTKRLFSAKRMCYRSSVDGWLELIRGSGALAELARDLIPTLGTDDFFELF